ncbi:MAG: type II secretion system protein [bacterium]|nr:type II secretion system protein [bacterium]
MGLNRRKGFSLTEIVIVVGIISLMSSLVLARIPALRTQTRVSASAANMKRVILDARRRSTSIIEFKAGSNVFPSYGAFVELANPGRITIFADCKLDDNGDGTISNQDYFFYNQASVNCPAPNSNGFVENIFLEQGITIKAIRTFSSNPMSGAPQTKGSVEYLRPEPSIWISYGNSGTLLGLGGLAIDIADVTNTYKKTIVIWITGNIEIL